MMVMVMVIKQQNIDYYNRDTLSSIIVIVDLKMIWCGDWNRKREKKKKKTENNEEINIYQERFLTSQLKMFGNQCINPIDVYPFNKVILLHKKNDYILGQINPIF